MQILHNQLWPNSWPPSRQGVLKNHFLQYLICQKCAIGWTNAKNEIVIRGPEPYLKWPWRYCRPLYKSKKNYNIWLCPVFSSQDDRINFSSFAMCQVSQDTSLEYPQRELWRNFFLTYKGVCTIYGAISDTVPGLGFEFRFLRLFTQTQSYTFGT